MGTMSCCSECIWKKHSYLYFTSYSLSLDSHLGDNPGEAAGTGWRSVLFRAVVLSILLPSTKWFCFLEVPLEVCSSRGISFSFFSSTTIFKIHFFGHFIKILGRKAKHWLYLINHIDLKHPILNQALLRTAYLSLLVSTI